MKLTLALLAAPALAFTAPQSTTGLSTTALSAYVPSGMSPDEWKKIQAKEKKAKTNLGAGGARGFKSRSFDSFVNALEKGEATHLFAVNPDDVKSGKVALKDVPYMQRGGAWDNTDLAKGKGKWMKAGSGTMTAFNDGKAKIYKETAKDKAYNQGGAGQRLFLVQGRGDGVGSTRRVAHLFPSQALTSASSASRSTGAAARRAATSWPTELRRTASPRMRRCGATPARSPSRRSRR